MSVALVSQDDLLGIIDEALLSVIDEGVDGEAACPSWGADAVTAGVDIDGAWRGRVTLTSSLDGAAVFSAQMLRMDRADIDFDDMRDAVGELANILGGAVKGALGRDCVLSLPWFEAGVRPDEGLVVSVCVTWQGFPLRVCVFEGGDL